MVRKLAGALAAAAAWTSAAAGPTSRRPLVWGVDLGNANIVMAVASRNGVDVVTNDVSGRQTPSAVYFAGNHRLTGEHTTGHAGGNPRNLVHHLKSLLTDGDKAEEKDVQTDGVGEDGDKNGRSSVSGDSSPHATAAGTTDSSDMRSSTSATTTAVEPKFFCETRRGGQDGRGPRRAVVRHMGQELELEASEVISYLLRHCAEVVAREATAGIQEGNESTTIASSSCVVASVPSFFSLRQRRAVLDAASIAGVPMPLVVDQGTAVALAYGVLGGGAATVSAGPPRKIAFVDIGHSCTQVTVASFTEAGVRILGRGCAKRGGTAAAEACVYDRICRTARAQSISVEGRPRAEFRLAKALTSAIKTLSANQEARLSVECIDGDKDLAITLTREEVEEACSGVAAGVSKACREALRAAGIGAEDMDAVELLGGGSYIPLLRRSVESTFGRGRVRRTMSSSESVARGCALAAAQHSSVFKLRPFRVVDSLPRDLRLVWRYDDDGDGDDDSHNNNHSGSSSSSRRGSSSDRDSSPSSSGDSGGGAERGIEERGGTGAGATTGVVDVPMGTAIPWSKAVTIDLGGGGRLGGQEKRERVFVDLMEGADRVASYVVDVEQPRSQSAGSGPRGGKRGVFRGWGMGVNRAAAAEGDASGAASAAVAPEASRLKVSFLVDGGGVPSVQSARLEYEEEITEFVEIPAPVEPVAAAAAAESSSCPAGTIDGNGDGGVEMNGSSDDCGATAPTADAAAAAAKTALREDQDAVEAGSEQAQGAEKQTKDQEQEQEEQELNSEETGASDKKSDGTGREPDAAGGTPEGKSGGGQPEEGSKDKGAGDANYQGGDGDGISGAQPKTAAKMVKVPRVVTRRRSRPLRLKQTYSGMLEGAELEAARERERGLREQDEAVRSANEARNTLENLIYSSRSSLEPGDGDLSAFVSPSEASGILTFLEDTEEWLYGAMSGGESGEGAVPEEEVQAFEQRTSSLRQRLAEPQARRHARVGLVTALAEAEAVVERGEAQLKEAAAQESLTSSQLQDGENELESTRRVVAETRKKLEDLSSGGELGSFLGRLPSQEADVRKKTEHLQRVLAFARKEHS